MLWLLEICNLIKYCIDDAFESVGNFGSLIGILGLLGRTQLRTMETATCSASTCYNVEIGYSAATTLQQGELSNTHGCATGKPAKNLWRIQVVSLKLWGILWKKC